MYTLSRTHRCDPRLDPIAEIERLFGGVGGTEPSAFAPTLDVSEDEAAFTVRAELPGVAPDDVQVTVEDGVLSIRGEKKSETTETKGRAHRVERRFGRFERSVSFPVAIDPEAVAATHRHGVLTVRLPKDAKSRARTVQVRTDA